MPRQGRHFRKRTTRLHESTDERVSQGMQTHVPQSCSSCSTDYGHADLIERIGAAIRLREDKR